MCKPFGAAGDGLQEIGRSARDELELPSYGAGRYREVLRDSQRHVEAVLCEEVLLLGDPDRQPSERKRRKRRSDRAVRERKFIEPPLFS